MLNNDKSQSVSMEVVYSKDGIFHRIEVTAYKKPLIIITEGETVVTYTGSQDPFIRRLIDMPGKGDIKIIDASGQVRVIQTS